MLCLLRQVHLAVAAFDIVGSLFELKTFSISNERIKILMNSIFGDNLLLDNHFRGYMFHARDVNKAMRRSCSLSIGGLHLVWTSALWGEGLLGKRQASAKNRL